MDAITVYRHLHNAGLSVSAVSGRILAAPAARLTNELRDLIRENKPALLGLLAEAHETTAELLTAAMRTCDHFNDGKASREQMHGDCLATPPHLRADLLAHFRQSYGDCEDCSKGGRLRTSTRAPARGAADE